MPELALALAALLAEAALVAPELTPMPIPVAELPPVAAALDVVAAAVPLLLALIVSTVPLQVTPGARLVSCFLDATPLGTARASLCAVPV
jgi:hypothetical protein